jgi:hypothetical protein
MEETAVQNLLVNPGFEMGSSGSPDNWRKYSKGTIPSSNLYIYPETGRGDTGYSVSINFGSNNYSGRASWIQNVPNLKANTSYILFGYMKFTNVAAPTGYGATIGIDWFKGSTYISSKTITSQTGTKDWLSYSRKVTSPSNANNANIWLMLTNGSGKVYFDDIFFGESTTTIGAISGNTKNLSGDNIAGAKVSDGTRSTITDSSGNYKISNVPAGTYTVTASATGYSTVSITNVVVTSGVTTSGVNFSLSPTIGSIFCNAKDSAGTLLPAAVYLDSSTTSVGNAPITLNDIATGQHSITYKYTGYNDCTKSVTVYANQKADATCTMSLATGDTIRVKITDPAGANCLGVPVNAIVTLDIETEYLPYVVASENGAAPYESMKAQAIESRTFAYYKIIYEPSGDDFDLVDNVHDQVYHPCLNLDTYPGVRQSVIDTNGIVVKWGYWSDYNYPPGCAPPSTVKKVIICGFFVSGSGSYAQYVTYNEGKSGECITQTTNGSITNPPSLNPWNRGSVGAIQANALASDNGYTRDRILRYFYGDDIIIESK